MSMQMSSAGRLVSCLLSRTAPAVNQGCFSMSAFQQDNKNTEAQGPACGGSFETVHKQFSSKAGALHLPLGFAVRGMHMGSGSSVGVQSALVKAKVAGSAAAVPWAATQAMTMASGAYSDSRTGTLFSSLTMAIYKFWRSQAPFEKPHTPVDSRTLPGIIAASDERASVGTWCTALFGTILGCNLLGLVPFFEAPTSGLGLATGLGVSVWATATTLGFYKLGFKFPGHFIPGGTPWPMAFIFVPLETISYSFRAISLGVRLWVNMLAGHTLLHILTGMALALPFSLPIITGVPATFAVCCLLVALVGLEYLVAVLQSGVFAILSSVYIGEFNSVHAAVPLAKIVAKKLHH